MKTLRMNGTPVAFGGAGSPADLDTGGGRSMGAAGRTVVGLFAVLLTMVLVLATAGFARADFGIEPGSYSAKTHDGAGNEVTQAGAHPNATVDFMLSTTHYANGALAPEGSLKDGSVTLPAGFVGDPQATQVCAKREFLINSCSRLTMVGMSSFTFLPLINAPGSLPFTYDLPVYNLAAPKGVAARFGFQVASVSVVIDTTLKSNGDYHLESTFKNTSQALVIFGSKLTLWGVPADMAGPGPFSSMIGSYGGPSGAPRKAFLTTPSWCAGPIPVTSLRLNSWQQPDLWASESVAASSAPTGCDRLTFQPTFTATPDTTAPDSPSGLSVDIGIPQDTNPDGLATPPLRTAVVTLPEGMTINPSSASGLEACSDQQLGLGNDHPVTCPAAAKIGTVTAKTPVLEGPVEGSVYIRSQQSDDPESGEMFRIALVMENKDRGVLIKLGGQIRVNKDTGRIETVFDNNPQLPVSSIKLQFKGGPRAPLATPPTCGPKTVSARLTSWGGQVVERNSTFQIACTNGLGAFTPSFSAGTISPQAGGSSPFALRINKGDGQSALNGLSMTLPEGLLANLKGNLGTQVGTARVAAGPGSSPFWLSGPVVLEGAYDDAPFSLRVTVPAVAGPFNLGNVVVRQKIFINPHDAHVTIVSDPLPTIVRGVPVRLQNLAVDVDKAGFMKNPTSCAVKSISGSLAAVTGQTAAVSSRFQVGGCADLPLKPKMKMDLIGKKETKRGKHPKLSATLTQKAGESGLRKVKIRLPLSLALDPDNAQALCKPEQAAAKACPAGSIVGKATAVTPLLDQPLTGNVYFVEGTRLTKEGRIAKTLPKLWVALRGQVALDVWADSALGEGQALETTFGFVPDAPISSFKMDIDGGAHGILAVTGALGASLCKQALTSKADYDGQNGKHVTSKVRMSAPCGFQVSKKSLTNTHAKITVAGIGAGKLSISGKGIRKASRTVKSASVATIQPRLTTAGMRTAKAGRSLRLRVSFNPKGKGKTRHATTVVKRAKTAATR